MAVLWCLSIFIWTPVRSTALRLTECFGSAYLCEEALSHMKIIKSIYRSRLTNEHSKYCLHLCPNNYEPSVSKLSHDMRCYASNSQYDGYWKTRFSYGNLFGHKSTFNRAKKIAATFANNINESGWETLAQRRLIARICGLCKAYSGRRAWKAIGDRILKSCHLSGDDHNRKIRTRKQRTDVGKYSVVNRAIKSWNQLPAGLLASFHCKLNTFRKRLRM